MNKQQAKGYLLEIVLSKLIEVNGYEVITEWNIPYEPELPPEEQEIRNQSNGLNIKGRGGYHQFDTLGTFKITPPFVYPLRLFMEAKCYSKNYKIGIDRVRMGVGLLSDINSNYSTVNMSSNLLSISRYHYHYAIFSTSGFSEPAQRFALAHKIYLVDLSGEEYKPIINLVNQTIYVLFNRKKSIPKEEFNEFKSWFNQIIREERFDSGVYNAKLNNIVLILKENIKDKYLYLATTNSSYLIPLLTDPLFNRILKNNPHQKIAIKWDRKKNNKWFIIPEDNVDIRIGFILPKLLDIYWKSKLNLEESSFRIKKELIKKMSFIAYLDNKNPTLCTLTFDRQFTEMISL